jgi:ubiquinol-cytochrome c reductase iron-sulfur subunit
VALVRPEDQEPGSMMTVFPFRESERGNEEALLGALHRSDNPVMLIRLRPGTPVTLRPGFEKYHYGDYFAYSKICTHLGCPTSLYETQTNRILCPCHQSQFVATEYAKPVFGPAARPLPQLPITVNDEGYLVATGDFAEAIGPSFWEIHGS